MPRRIRRAAARGRLVVALVCLSTALAPAAPRAEEPRTAMLLRIQDLADHVPILFDGWLRTAFAPSGGASDANG